MSKMTEQEFAAKCEHEGVEYAVNEYGLSADDLEPGSLLHAAMVAVDYVKPAWQKAIAALEDALEDIESPE